MPSLQTDDHARQWPDRLADRLADLARSRRGKGGILEQPPASPAAVALRSPGAGGAFAPLHRAAGAQHIATHKHASVVLSAGLEIRARETRARRPPTARE